MEITLNLLPPYLLRQRQVQRRKQARALAAAAAVVPILLAYVLLNARIHALRLDAARLDRRVAALTPAAAKARQLDDDLAGLRRREDALSQLTVRLPRWSTVLVQLSDLLPPDASFTSLAIANGQFIVVGQALTEGTVSVLATRLASARFLTGTSLKYVREQDLGTRRIYLFEIDGTVRAEGQPP